MIYFRANTICENSYEKGKHPELEVRLAFVSWLTLISDHRCFSTRGDKRRNEGIIGEQVQITIRNLRLPLRKIDVNVCIYTIILEFSLSQQVFRENHNFDIIISAYASLKHNSNFICKTDKVILPFLPTRNSFFKSFYIPTYFL